MKRTESMEFDALAGEKERPAGEPATWDWAGGPAGAGRLYSHSGYGRISRRPGLECGCRLGAYRVRCQPARHPVTGPNESIWPVWYGMVPLLPPGPQSLRPGGGGWIGRRLSMLRLSPFRPRLFGDGFRFHRDWRQR
jgi:hypothetical protein